MASKGADLQGKLRDAADQHAPGECGDRRVAVRREEERGADDREVEEDGRHRRNREAAVHVQNAARQRDEGNEQDVGEHDPDHLRREIDLARRVREPRRQQVDEPRRGEDSEDRDRQKHDGKQRADPPCERFRLHLSPLAPVLGENGDKRLREGAFGEEPAQDVRQPESGLEGVHLHACAECRCLEALAGEPGDAGQERHPADRRDRPQELQRRSPGVAPEAEDGEGQAWRGTVRRTEVTGRE